VKYHSFVYVFLTKICWKRILGQCLVGSLTGAVACSRVMQAYQGRLSADGNRAGRIKAKAGLTARLTSRAGTKVGLSDPPYNCDGCRGLTDKSYPGDNRLVVPESPYRRRGSTPQHIGVFTQKCVIRIWLITVKPYLTFRVNFG